MLVDCAPRFQAEIGGWEGACWWRPYPGVCRHWTILGKIDVLSQLSIFDILKMTCDNKKKKSFISFQHTTKENDLSVVNASFHVTHWSVQPYGTGISRMKYVGYVFGGDVLRFFHGGDECLTIPSTWSPTPSQKCVFNYRLYVFWWKTIVASKYIRALTLFCKLKKQLKD